jgi:hypothetical protein
MNYLRRKERWPIALDIGMDSIKMLQLDEADGAMDWRARRAQGIERGQDGDEAAEQLTAHGLP